MSDAVPKRSQPGASTTAGNTRVRRPAATAASATAAAWKYISTLVVMPPSSISAAPDQHAPPGRRPG